jgi:hypothetical protein
MEDYLRGNTMGAEFKQKFKKFHLSVKIESFMYVTMKRVLPNSFNSEYEKLLIRLYEEEDNLVKKTKFVVEQTPYVPKYTNYENNAFDSSDDEK